MSFFAVQLFAAFGPLGTPEIIVILVLLLMLGGVTAAVVFGALWMAKHKGSERSPELPRSRGMAPPAEPSPPPLPQTQADERDRSP